MNELQSIVSWGLKGIYMISDILMVMMEIVDFYCRLI
jgi:hypothetical protein